MKFKIEHREELVGYFEVEAENESEAMNAYQHLVQEAKIDYGDMEMVDSSDQLMRPDFEVGQECFWAVDKVHPEDRCFIITSIRRRYSNGESEGQACVPSEAGNMKSWVEFDAIRHDGTVIRNEVLSPDRFWRTGRTYPALFFTKCPDASILMFGTEQVWPINTTNKRKDI